MIYTKIAGTGRYLPERILTNADLEKMVDTTSEWIRTRTGVERRHVATAEQTTSDLCLGAAKIAIDDAGVTAEDIDLIIIGTTSPDLVFPNIATIVQHRLGVGGCPAFSLEAACTGFIYALTTADKFIRAGEAKCALVI
jgi:3-oxoacyl-[acyl-carrier-protein] synthase-3